MHKSILYHWFEPDGYHKLTCQSTHEWDDTPGNQFNVNIYYTGELVATAKYDAAKFSRRAAELEAIAWFGSEIHPILNYSSYEP